MDTVAVATYLGWWVLAVALGTVELFVGGFYLLVLAVAMAVAGVAAWFGASLGTQLLVAAGLSVAGVLSLRHVRALAPRPAAPEHSRDLHLDIGQMVEVAQWEASGHARVNYRGTQWQAELLSGYPRRTGRHRIHGLHGSRLVLIPVESASHAMPAATPVGTPPPAAAR
ncbi:MAG: NfeD family protein [Lautropia sp.]|nr:NfeD family protein [Lautropia sp.]